MRFTLRWEDGSYSVSEPGIETCDVVTADEVSEKNKRIAALEAALHGYWRNYKRAYAHQQDCTCKGYDDTRRLLGGGGTSALDAMLREARAKGVDYAAESFAASGCNGATETLKQIAAAIRHGEVE